MSPTVIATTSFPGPALFPSGMGSLGTTPLQGLVPRLPRLTEQASIFRSQLQAQQQRERPLVEVLPEETNAIEEWRPENRQRQRHAHHWLPSARHSWYIFTASKCEPTNQIRVLGPTGARVAAGLLRVYKAGSRSVQVIRALSRARERLR